MNKQEFLDRNQRRALGKGLSALLPGKNGPAATRPESAASSSAATARALYPPLPEKFERFESISLDDIVPGESQPRTSFEPEKLEELAQSIRAHGILQPITVRRRDDGRYRIVAGERRWRAARLAGLKEIPCLVRIVVDDELLELALIENIQREDLNPIETAIAFSRLIEQHHLSHEQIAERTGKDRSTITNFLRLLKLAPEVQEDVVRGDISMGHARALLGLPSYDEQRQAAQQVIDGRLSVRDTERLVKSRTEPQPPKLVKLPTSAPELDANMRAAVEELKLALGTKVRLVPRSGHAGRIEIEYYSQDDLDRIYAAIVR
jgi:ParB family transcriptional regulator, chromosome partitioning protein